MRLSFDDSLIIHNAQPFTGQGVSLYVSIGSTVQYRDQRIDTGMSLGEDPDITKTTRVASAASPTTSITPTWDPDWQGQSISVNIRQYKDGVENENTDHVTIDVDGYGDATNTIDGTATLLAVEKRDGGVCRLRFVWTPALTGLQPTTFTAIRTAGPTSPANATVSNTGTGRRILEIDTPALSDASAYTYTIQAIAGAATLDVLTGISVTADATGPVVPTAISVSDW